VASLATAPHTRLGCPESKTGLVRKRRKASRGPCVVLETLGWGEAKWEREVGVALFLRRLKAVGVMCSRWSWFFILARLVQRRGEGSEVKVLGERQRGTAPTEAFHSTCRVERSRVTRSFFSMSHVAFSMSFPLFSPESPMGRRYGYCTVEHMGLPSAVKLYPLPLLHPLAYSRQCSAGRMTRRAALDQLDQQQPSAVQRSRGHVRLALSLISMPCHTSDYPQSVPLTGSACRRHDLPGCTMSPPAVAI
jgi:hypothetical protein